MKANKNAIAMAITLATGLTLGSVAQAGSHGGMSSYATSGSNHSVVRSGFGECWNATGGYKAAIEECGDKVMKKMPAPAAPADSDGDGIIDANDSCPNTPKGAKVNGFGCALDSDRDGVADYKDACPDTKAGATVNAKGCAEIGKIVIQTSADHFDFDSAALKPAMEAALDDVAAKIANAQDTGIAVVGHTDATGPAAYNQGLSERRAQAAADYLSSKGVQNISVSGQGESSPVADNGTREGRAANRRVEVSSN